jgi:hypothetical protein
MIALGVLALIYTVQANEKRGFEQKIFDKGVQDRAEPNSVAPQNPPPSSSTPPQTAKHHPNALTVSFSVIGGAAFVFLCVVWLCVLRAPDSGELLNTVPLLVSIDASRPLNE